MGRRATRVGTNRRAWDRAAAAYERRHAGTLRGSRALAWGLWRLPERELDLLGPVRGRRVLELGCGAARWSVGLARRGATLVGLDVSRERLRQAADEARKARTPIALVQASAERLPFRAGRFDTVFSDWGAMSFADPRETVPEVARVLRPGGRLVFATASPLRELARNPATDRIEAALHRPYFGSSGTLSDGMWEYSLPYGGWFDLFERNGMSVERLVETRPPEKARSTYVTAAEARWARRWPLEVLWRVRRAPVRAASRAGRR